MPERKRLINRVETKVRFSEVDSMRVVWHGSYVKYLEDGRESFGDEYQLGYYDVFENKYMTPIVKLDINYKRTIKYGERVIIETEYVATKAAKIIFNYKIINAETKEVALTAQSVQVFINTDEQLQLTNPDFYIKWQKKMGVFTN